MRRFRHLLLIAGLCAIIPGCSDKDGTVNTPPTTGAYSFQLVFPAGSPGTAEAQAPAAECAGSGVETVTVTISGSDDVEVASGSWPCPLQGETLRDIPPGAGYRAEFLGLDGTGTVIFTGTDTGITITAGEVTGGDPIVMARVVIDTTPPTVESVAPAPSAVDVPGPVAVTATFSEALDGVSITDGVFTLHQGAIEIAGTVTLDGQTLTFTPLAALAGDRIYTATVSAGVADLAGNVSLADHVWSFTTLYTGSSTTTNSLGMTFGHIPPGTFTMGAPNSEDGWETDETIHEVTLSRGFSMQTTEVTQGQWVAVMGGNPSSGLCVGDDCPVENMTWDEVQQFIGALNSLGEGTYRLPTEAEWEYCARAGTTTPFHTGGCLSTDEANYYGDYPYSGCAAGINRGAPVAVGSFAANAWGLHDMHGNVLEWCAGWHGTYPPGPVTDPTGPPSGDLRVSRGGAYASMAAYCRSAARYDNSADFANPAIGFRLVLENAE